MNYPSDRQRKSFVILTPNYVEAIDLAEALAFDGPSEALHVPTAAELVAKLANADFRPDGAILAGAFAEPHLDACILQLKARGARLVFVDGRDEYARELGALQLRRPYGAEDLGPVLAALGGQPPC
ncbi:hypothetical protein [Tropicimonas sp. IMCC34043]|uniref:hypothetical protein n=1 Tax=Tropicimonas sp. IMCC34043 TaxID=2248760 RepID=UPI0013002BB9|nr:hypothetical protein [Tropicimonas sp. IMCC34043]